MLPMIPAQPNQTEDELTTIQTAIAALETELAATKTALANALGSIPTTDTTGIETGLSNITSAINATPTPSVVRLDGQSVFRIDTIAANDTITIADNLDYVQASIVFFDGTSWAYPAQNIQGEAGSGGASLVATTPSGVSELWVYLDSSGNLKCHAGTGGPCYNVLITFFSYPALGVGLVGPQGPAGESWGEWVNLSLNSGWFNVNLSTYGACRYRTSGKNVQVSGLVSCTSISTNRAILSLPAEATPTKRVPLPTVLVSSVAYPYRIDIEQDGTINTYPAPDQPNSGNVSMAIIYHLD